MLSTKYTKDRLSINKSVNKEIMVNRKMNFGWETEELNSFSSVCRRYVVNSISLWNRSPVWIWSPPHSQGHHPMQRTMPSSLNGLWCPDDLLVFTPVPLQFILHTEARVILLKHKQVVPHLCSKTSDVWESRLPQNKTSLYRMHALACPLPLWPAPVCLSLCACLRFRLQAVFEVSCLWAATLAAAYLPLLRGAALLFISLPLGLDSPQWGFPVSPSHFLLSFSAFLFSLALFTL